MRPHRSTSIGLLMLAFGFVLALASFVVPLVWFAALVRGAPDTFLGQSLRILWIPVTMDLLFIATAVLGLVGFLFVWKGRGEFDPDYSSRIGLAFLAVVLAVITFGLWMVVGIVLGFVPGSSGLVPWRRWLVFLGTVFVGFALYWTLANLPISGIRPVSAVAFASAVLGGAAVILTTLDPRRAPDLVLQGAATALSLLSTGLWLALCVWGGLALRMAHTGPPRSPAPSRDG